MKKVLVASMVMLCIILLLYGIRFAIAAKASPGEQAFVEHCALCHAQGGNIINAAKTLQKKSLAANGIRKPADIVEKMRNPGPGMTKFDKETLPDRKARAIAEYILKTFK